MKYIGPFLRMNSLTLDNIRSQIFHLSKEAVKTLALNSKCGIQIPYKEFIKNIPNFDNNTKSSFYPLMCLYKKASPKVTFKHDKMIWNESKFKKEIDISSNAFLTLSLLELSDYYKQFKEINSGKFKLSMVYDELSKKQLEFFGNHLRNQEGLFVNMQDLADPLMGDYKFETKGPGFKYYNQAFMMCAYYKCSLTLENEDESKSYKMFAYDILKMFMNHREELYTLPYAEIVKLSIALNVFYMYSKEFEVKNLIMDLTDLLRGSYSDYKELSSGRKLDTDLLMYMNYFLVSTNTGITQYKDDADKLYATLTRHYSEEQQVLFKNTESKETSYSSNELILYFSMCFLNAFHSGDDDALRMCVNTYKNTLVNSGIVLSWPDSPDLDDPERYKSFSLKSEDLLDEQNFRLPSIGTPKTLEVAPIFTKKVTFSKKKDMFKPAKSSFDSSKNMHLFYLFIMMSKHLLRDESES